jgi:hypothetical protein
MACVLFGVVFDEAANRVLRAVTSTRTYEVADGLQDLFEFEIDMGHARRHLDARHSILAI